MCVSGTSTTGRPGRRWHSAALSSLRGAVIVAEAELIAVATRGAKRCRAAAAVRRCPIRCACHNPSQAAFAIPAAFARQIRRALRPRRAGGGRNARRGISAPGRRRRSGAPPGPARAATLVEPLWPVLSSTPAARARSTVLSLVSALPSLPSVTSAAVGPSSQRQVFNRGIGGRQIFLICWYQPGEHCVWSQDRLGSSTSTRRRPFGRAASLPGCHCSHSERSTRRAIGRAASAPAAQ